MRRMAKSPDRRRTASAVGDFPRNRSRSGTRRRATGSIISCRWRRSGRRPRPSCARVSLRSRSPNCASSAAKARWSTPCRRTAFHWRSWMRSRARPESRSTGGEIRCRQDAELCAGGRAGTADRSPPRRRTVEQLGVFRRIRDAQDLSAPSARAAPGNRDVAVSGRARRVRQYAAAAGYDRTRARRR